MRLLGGREHNRAAASQREAEFVLRLGEHAIWVIAKALKCLGSEKPSEEGELVDEGVSHWVRGD
jgi:hypothetical protein